MRSRSNHQKTSNNVSPMHKGAKVNHELRPDLWDERYSDKDREKLMVVAQAHGLDPMTREVIVIKGNIYVTAAGLQKLALNDPTYDGCEVELVQTDWKNNFFVIKARVWKKDCAHPFEDYGDADPTTSNLRGHALFRHAITRARARALRSAFAIPFCSVEELDDEFRRLNTSSNQNQNKRPKQWSGKEEGKPELATEQQQKMLERYRKELGWKEEELEAHITQEFGLGRDELTRVKASQLLNALMELTSKPTEDLPELVKKTPKAEAKREIIPAEAPKEAKAPVEAKAEAPKAEAPQVEEADKTPDEAPEAEATPAAEAPVVEAPAEAQEAEAQEAKEEEAPVALEEPARPKRASNAAKRAQRMNTLPRWTADEQKRIADDLVQRMQQSKTLKELKREWELFQGIRHQLSEEWFARICETKEQRKAVLAAAA